MRGTVALGTIVIGGLVAGAAFSKLREKGEAGYHRNPFAMNQSGYGLVLARLGQTNLDRAWHFGEVAGELSHRGEHDEHAGHNHGDGGHNEEERQHEAGKGLVEPALDFLVDLDAERFRRTSRAPISAAHEKAIAGDIEKMMLRAYNMAPTDYGAYDAYFHFLMHHRLRGTLEDRKRAHRMSEYTIQAAVRETSDPLPWLTAAVATLNQFFMDQQDYRKEKGDAQASLPAEVLVKYRERTGYCLAQYFSLQEEAVKAGRWGRMSEQRREEADERARLGGKMMEQFQAMIDRRDGGKAKAGDKNAERAAQ